MPVPIRQPIRSAVLYHIRASGGIGPALAFEGRLRVEKGPQHAKNVGKRSFPVQKGTA